MDEMTPDLQAIGLTVTLGAAVYLGIVGVVALARLARPTVDRLAEVDLGGVSSAFGDALGGLGEVYMRPTPRSNTPLN